LTGKNNRQFVKLKLKKTKKHIFDEISPDSVLTKYFCLFCFVQSLNQHNSILFNFNFQPKLTGFVHNIFVLGVCVGHLDAD
jgi:hypothetical protein